MDVWDTFPQVSRRSNRREDHHPSFSSTLLDAIYRSIDDDQVLSTMRNNKNNPFQKYSDGGRKPVAGELVKARRKSMPEYSDRPASNSSSASSDSSAGGFSSSESDHSFYKPKPIRTSSSEKFAAAAEKMNQNHHHHYSATHQKQSKREGGFVRTKSKALKIYSDLKKVKQPISPGGRLASFLNSLFTNAKKTKTEQQTTTTTTTCSSASSFSRSCLSKTPSSRSATKRSVTFYPAVSVIADVESSKHNQIKNYQTDHDQKDLEFRILEENRRVVEAAKELLKSYHKKKLQYDDINGGDDDDHKAAIFISEDEEEEEEDDGASCASSDLFELDNLSAIGIDQRYREELPVYETTHLDTNRAIASGLFV